MRLRSKLALAFLLVALLPAGLILTLGLRTMQDALEAELHQRLEASVRTVRAFDAEQRQALVRRLEGVTQSPAMDELLESLDLGDAASLQGAGERLLQQATLDVFAVLDEGGRTVTSGHWPARINEQDAVLFEATEQAKEPLWMEVALPTAEGPRSSLALVAAVPVRAGSSRLWAVGGTFVAPHWAPTLAALSGAKVELQEGERVLARAGNATPPVVERRVPETDFDEPRVQWTLAFSRAPLLDASRKLTQAALALTALGFTGALLLAWAIARRVTRPVEALTHAARQLASGDLTARVSQPATGEVGALVESFNQMGQDLQSTTRRLVASERAAAWQDVARGLAHELKNPLTPIRMSLETLLAAQEHPSFRTLFAQSAPVMLEEVERLRRTIDEFSRFARLPSPTLSTLDLGAWAEQVLVLHGALPPAVTLVRELERDVYVRADRDQLTQLLLNLIRNAEEAMTGAARGETGDTLRIRVARVGESACLEVADSGPGIPLSLRQKVLEPHFSTKNRGSGLGLSIAARICQEHGGTLELHQAPEGGALVRVSLPLSAPAQSS